jgi:hypothetical protein
MIWKHEWDLEYKFVAFLYFLWEFSSTVKTYSSLALRDLYSASRINAIPFCMATWPGTFCFKLVRIGISALVWNSYCCEFKRDIFWDVCQQELRWYALSELINWSHARCKLNLQFSLKCNEFSKLPRTNRFTNVSLWLCFCWQNPVVYIYIFVFSITGYLGIIIVLSLVKVYGALIAVTGN